MSTTSFNTSSCDKCGRNLNGKGYVVVSGWNICGICQWEKNVEYKIDKEHIFVNENSFCLYNSSSTSGICDSCGKHESEHNNSN